MITCRVKNLSGREVLAENIYLPNGQILMKQGTPLKSEYINSLLELGVETLWIKNPYKIVLKPNYYIDDASLDYFKYELRKILEQHIYKKNEPLKKVRNLANELTDILIQSNLSSAIDVYARKSDLYEHIIYTTVLSLAVGIRMGLKKNKLTDLAFGSMIHDIGLRFVNVSFFNCDFECMSPKEVFELKNHSILGYTSIESEEWIPQIVKTLVLSHHEKKDGSGYPLKQKNKQVECSILQICDTFDGIISGVERKRGTLISGIEEIQIKGKKKYHERAAEEFLNLIGRFPTGSMIESEKHFALVIQQTDNPMRPMIMSLDNESEIYDLRKKIDFVIKAP